MVANPVQHALGHVGEGHYMVKGEQARRALDGVGGAEDGVDGFRIVRGLLEQQRASSMFWSSSRFR
jgi:hypothetical protein